MKPVGALLLITAFALVGHVYAAKKERRVRQLTAIVAGLHRLESEIVFGRTMLSTAFWRVARQSGDAAWLFSAAAQRSEAGYTAAESWEHAVGLWSARSDLEAGDCEPLLRLTDVIGLTEAQDQARFFQLVRAELNAILDQARDKLPAITRVYRALGVGGGLIAAILLY